MPRGKQTPTQAKKNEESQASSIADKQPKSKKTEESTREKPFNEEKFTVSELKDLIKSLANDLYEKKKEDLKAEMDEEMEYKLIVQFGEIEEMIDEVKAEVRKNYNTLNRQFEKLKNDVQSAKQQTPGGNVSTNLSPITKQIEDMESVNQKLKRRIEKVEFEIASKISGDIKDLKSRTDSMEQQQYNNNIQMVGLPENENSEQDLKTIVKLAQEKLGMNLKKAEIKETYRLGKRKPDGKPRDVIVKFRLKKTREAFYNNRKKLITSTDTHANIYVNDHLTQHRQHLLYAARPRGSCTNPRS